MSVLEGLDCFGVPDAGESGVTSGFSRFSGMLEQEFAVGVPLACRLVEAELSE